MVIWVVQNLGPPGLDRREPYLLVECPTFVDLQRHEFQKYARTARTWSGIVSSDNALL